MSSAQLYTSELTRDFSASFFGTSFDDNNEYDLKQNDEIYLRFSVGNQISAVVNNEDVPSKLYHAYGDYNFDNDFFNVYKQDDCDLSSVMGENEYQDKKEDTNCHDTQTTLKDDASSCSKKCYEALFTMVEDKNLYEIGNGNDEVTVGNNSDLLELDRIISDDYTDLNSFIGDMLKSCPCDNLIKKQRIYKAKNIKRKRKTKSQVKVLEREFKLNTSWSTEDIKRISEVLDLSRDQVYKWFWDQKKKSDN